MGHGAPGKRKSDSRHIVIRFADGLDRFGDAGQIVNRDAAQFAATFGCIVQNAVIFFTIAAGAVVALAMQAQRAPSASRMRVSLSFM